jgi:hypothetical protein
MRWTYTNNDSSKNTNFNFLNTELNPTCHLLALLEKHHILHVSRVRVKSVINKLAQIKMPIS